MSFSCVLVELSAAPFAFCAVVVCFSGWLLSTSKIGSAATSTAFITSLNSTHGCPEHFTLSLPFGRFASHWFFSCRGFLYSCLLGSRLLIRIFVDTPCLLCILYDGFLPYLFNIKDFSLLDEHLLADLLMPLKNLFYELSPACWAFNSLIVIRIVSSTIICPILIVPCVLIHLKQSLPFFFLLVLYHLRVFFLLILRIPSSILSFRLNLWLLCSTIRLLVAILVVIMITIVSTCWLVLRLTWLVLLLFWLCSVPTIVIISSSSTIAGEIWIFIRVRVKSRVVLLNCWVRLRARLSCCPLSLVSVWPFEVLLPFLIRLLLTFDTSVQDNVINLINLIWRRESGDKSASEIGILVWISCLHRSCWTFSATWRSSTDCSFSLSTSSNLWLRVIRILIIVIRRSNASFWTSFVVIGRVIIWITTIFHGRHSIRADIFLACHHSVIWGLMLAVHSILKEF